YYYFSGVHTAYASFVPTQSFTPRRAVYGFTDALQQRRSLSLVGWGWPGYGCFFTRAVEYPFLVWPNTQ
ncbi:hypothetical protein, partial [Pseudomonas aeruginosa]